MQYTVIKEHKIDRKNGINNRIAEFDFIRAICTLGIVINHYTIAVDKYCKYIQYFSEWIRKLWIFYRYHFFILSGVLLYQHHADLKNITKFYIKRLYSIYPSYYVAYLPVFLLLLLLRPGYFKQAHPVAFFLTILGFDGYTSKAISNYYTLVGDWFLGIIILLYIVFPFILKGVKKNSGIYLFVALAFFIAFLNWRMLNQNAFRNIFSCVLSFSLGMIIEKLHLYKYISIPVLLTLCFTPIGFLVNFNILVHIVGICLFFILYYCGSVLKKYSLICAFDTIISKVSYEMFLIQHVIIVFACDFIKIDKSLKFISGLIALIVVIYIAALIIKRISSCLTKGIKRFVQNGRE